MVSTTTRAPKRAAVRPTAAWVAADVEERTVMSRAPAPSTISASRSPASTVLVSARTGVSGQSSRAVAIAPIPKRLRSGVPISMMSAIPRTCAITPKLSALSIATCSNTGRLSSIGGSVAAGINPDEIRSGKELEARPHRCNEELRAPSESGRRPVRAFDDDAGRR